MYAQPDLFAEVPRARRRDPETSHRAAAQVLGAAHAHRERIVAAIQTAPGLTYRQIALVTGLEPVAVGRRLVEVEREGRAKAGVVKTVDGRAMRTWWPV